MINTELRRVLRLALPAAFKHLLDILQILIDMIMVGMLNVYALAAVGMSMQFLMVINVLMTVYIVGGNAVIARLIGERRRLRASALLYTLILFALLASLPVGTCGYFFAEEFYLWMGADAGVAAYGERYFSIMSMGIAVIFLDVLFYNALSAAGDTTSSLYIKIFSALLNLLLNYLFIFGHGGFEPMGIAGAAYATIIAYSFNIVFYMLILLRKRGKLTIIRHICLRDIKRVVKVGGNAAVERLVNVIAYMTFIVVVTTYGTAALAGYQVGLRIEGLAFMPGFGFAVAAMALVGQNLGAKNPDAAYRSGLYSAKIAAWFMGMLGIVMVVVPEPMVMLFTKDAQTIEEASLYLRLVGVSQVPLALAFVLSGALRGAGATKTTMKINVSALWLLRVIPSIIAMKLGAGIVWIYIIMTVETFAKGAIFWVVYQRREWQKIKV